MDVVVQQRGVTQTVGMQRVEELGKYDLYAAAEKALLSATPKH